MCGIAFSLIVFVSRSGKILNTSFVKQLFQSSLAKFGTFYYRSLNRYLALLSLHVATPCFRPFWPVYQFCTNVDQFGPGLNILNHIDPFWRTIETNSDKFSLVLSIFDSYCQRLTQFDPFWPTLIKICTDSECWTTLINCNPSLTIVNKCWQKISFLNHVYSLLTLVAHLTR